MSSRSISPAWKGVFDAEGVIGYFPGCFLVFGRKKSCRYADFWLVATSALQPLLLAVCESSKLLGSPVLAGEEGVLAVACYVNLSYHIPYDTGTRTLCKIEVVSKAMFGLNVFPTIS